MTPRRVSPGEDVEVTALLRRYRIPRRHQPGTITDRFPHPYRRTAAFLHAAYTGIGLPGSHIEQFTGYRRRSGPRRLHHDGIPVRSPSDFSLPYQGTCPSQST